MCIRDSYRCAIMEVETKFKVLNEQFSLQYDRNPIETIKTRIKQMCIRDSVSDGINVSRQETAAIEVNVGSCDDARQQVNDVIACLLYTSRCV